MNRLIAPIWHLMRGTVQWRVVELPGPFSQKHDREVSGYMNGEIDAAELYRRRRVLDAGCFA